MRAGCPAFDRGEDMYEEQDYVMRLIHEVIRTLIRLVCGIDMDQRDELHIPPRIRERYLKWTAMIEDGQINEAENLLLDSLDPEDGQDFQLAMLFYEYLNQKDDDFLMSHRYSREEVLEGIKYAANLCGCGYMAEALLD